MKYIKKVLYFTLMTLPLGMGSCAYSMKGKEMEQEKKTISSILATSVLEQERPAVSANHHRYVLGFHSLFDLLPQDLIKLFWLLLNNPKVVSYCWEFAQQLNLQGEHLIHLIIL